MNTHIQNLSADGCLLVSTLGLLLLAACQQPAPNAKEVQESRITGLALTDRSGAMTPFRGYYVVDGVTNSVQGHMPATFVLDGHRLAYDITADPPGPKGWALKVSRFDAEKRAAGAAITEAGPDQKAIRGTAFVQTNWWEVNSAPFKH